MERKEILTETESLRKWMFIDVSFVTISEKMRDEDFEGGEVKNEGKT